MRLVVRFICSIACWCMCDCVRSADGVESVSAETIEVQLRKSACPCRKCFVAESLNFRIHCCSSAERITELAVTCETEKTRCQKLWVGRTSRNWHSKCELVVHCDAHSYCAALGRGSERTSGCTTIQLDRGRVVRRRIDLRGDAADCYSDSLPHELTHVVLADEFTERRIPAWADEGIAMLAESPDKLQRRLTELQGVVAANRSLSLQQLMSLAQSPAPESRDAFYGQSVTLTGLLLERGTPEQLLGFVNAAQRQGYGKALYDVYGIESWSALEREWRAYAGSQRLRGLAHHSLPDVNSNLSTSMIVNRPSAQVD